MGDLVEALCSVVVVDRNTIRSIELKKVNEPSLQVMQF